MIDHNPSHSFILSNFLYIPSAANNSRCTNSFLSDVLSVKLFSPGGNKMKSIWFRSHIQLQVSSRFFKTSIVLLPRNRNILGDPRVVAGKNTSTVIPANRKRWWERESSSLRWDSNVWLWVLRDSDHWQISLQITDPSSRQRERPKTKSKAIFQQKKGHGPQRGARHQDIRLTDLLS
jgi:hypothetical protein